MMKRRNLTILAASGALLLIPALQSRTEVADPGGRLPHTAGHPEALTPEALRKTAPDFALTDATGQPLTLSAFKGKAVLLDFWATWCGGCKLEIPWYVEFDQKYRSKGLAVIGVSMDEEGMKIVKPFLAAKHIQYPVVIGNDQLAKQYQLTSMPMTLLIDRNGKIAVSHTGVVDKDSFESYIQSLLKPPSSI
jgi:cytochrome c biogenesis protein CcmG/thiol:disulfide interchange protein DsbE